MQKALAFTFFGAALLIAIGLLSKDLFHKRQPPTYFSPFVEINKKAALASLRKMAIPELKVDYMKEDYFLARFLLPTFDSYEVPAALVRLFKHIQWRDQQNISTILQEDWSDMEAKFPVASGTFDLYDRPIFSFDVGKYDVANFLAEGGSAKRFLRYIINVLEESDVRVRQLRSQGKDVSQYIWILNLADYNITRHACLQCRQLFRSVGPIVIDYDPSMVELYFSLYKFVPELFPFVKSDFGNKFDKITYGRITDDTHEIHIFFDHDRDQWQSRLKPLVHPDQFPAWLKAEN